MASFEETRGTIREMYDYFRFIEDSAATSLTEYTKDTQINAPVYIQKSVAAEEITPALMGVLNQMYSGLILTALGLHGSISNSQTVRDAVRSVSTESYSEALDIIEKEFGNLSNIIPSNEGAVVKLDHKEQSLVSSRVVEYEFITGEKKADTVKIYMTCTLIPRMISAEVVKAVIALKYRPTNRDRWAQLTSGEISFWKDFVLCGDLLKQEAEGLRKDDSGILYDIINNANNGLSRALFNAIGLGRPKHNLSNVIFVTDAATMANATTKTHFSLDNYAQRQKFFLDTGMMMIVIIDPMYNLVEMYFNGIKHKGEYSFDMISKLGGGAKHDMDIKQVMTMFGAGSAPTKF